MTNEERAPLMKYDGFSRYEILIDLHTKGYSKEEIKELFKTINLPPYAWAGSFIGIAFIAEAIFYIATARKTGSFHFKWSHSGDVLRFTEWVMKPFIIFNFILLGCLLLNNRERFPFQLKSAYIVILLFQGFLSAYSNSVSGLLLALAGIVLIVLIKENSRKVAENLNINLADLGETRFDKAHSLASQNVSPDEMHQILLFNSWKGNIIFIVYTLATVLFFSNTISLPFEANRTFAPYINPIMMVVVIATAAAGICNAIDSQIMTKRMSLALMAVYGVSLLFITLAFGFQVAEVILAVLIITTAWAYKKQLK